MDAIQQQPQGIPVKPEYVLDEAYAEISRLTRENLMLKALVRELQEDEKTKAEEIVTHTDNVQE
jgi:hypothetical protein